MCHLSLHIIQVIMIVWSAPPAISSTEETSSKITSSVSTNLSHSLRTDSSTRTSSLMREVSLHPHSSCWATFSVKSPLRNKTEIQIKIFKPLKLSFQGLLWRQSHEGHEENHVTLISRFHGPYLLLVRKKIWRDRYKKEFRKNTREVRKRAQMVWKRSIISLRSWNYIWRDHSTETTW